MRIITLTTDFGTKDHYVGSIKGRIYSTVKDAKIIDISHDVSLNDIIQASYLIRSSFKNFPDGTIHLIGVDSELSLTNNHVVFEWNNQYFITSDNSIVSLIVTENKKSFKIFKLDRDNSFFPTLNVFTNIACKLANGAPIETLGTAIEDYELKEKKLPTSDKNKIITEVLYVDHYENTITNLDKDYFESISKGRACTIHFNGFKLDKIEKQYKTNSNISSEKIPQYNGLAIALFNSDNLLEIAIRNSNPKTGGAASLLGLKYKDAITIKFRD